MGIEEIIKLDSHKVRRDSSLMSIYVESFFTTFGYKPKCAGCTFDNDFNKLKKAFESKSIITKNLKVMATTNNTFKLKKAKRNILTYRINKRPFRMYDNKLTEEFAIAFLTHGTKQEIEERKKLFEVLPEPMRPKEKKVKEEPKPETEIVENDTTEENTPVVEEVKVTVKKERKPRKKRNSK